MTEQNPIIDEDTTEATTARFAKVKNAFSKIKPVHIAVATTAIATAAGMIIVSRIDKAINTLEDEVIIVEVETTPEV